MRENWQALNEIAYWQDEPPSVEATQREEITCVRVRGHHFALTADENMELTRALRRALLEKPTSQ